MNAAFARIILRYLIGGLAGAFAALGLLAPEAVQQIVGDKDLEFIIATALPGISAAAVEAWYWLAKRYGWST
jgi:lipopolysaccharide export LptBFGC system permease protein LptF